jgi:hypothetical protein
LLIPCSLPLTEFLQALKWATENEVDIISISWVIPPSSADLLKEAKNAANHALIFWSTADEGSRGSELSKLDPSNKFIRVSAANANNRAGEKADMSADILVSGEDIAADGPKYIKPNQNGNVSGSSVATALAAGIASLSLSLCRLANTPEDANEFKDKSMMLKIFGKMLNDGEEQKVINPSRIFDGDEKWMFTNEEDKFIQQDGRVVTQKGNLIMPSALSYFFTYTQYLPPDMRDSHKRKSSSKSEHKESGRSLGEPQGEQHGHAIAGTRDDSQWR